MKHYQAWLWTVPLMVLLGCASDVSKISMSKDSQGMLRYHTETTIGDGKVLIMRGLLSSTYELHYYNNSKEFATFDQTSPQEPAKVYPPSYPTKPSMPYPDLSVAHEYSDGQRFSPHRTYVSKPIEPTAPTKPKAPSKPSYPTKAADPAAPAAPNEPKRPSSAPSRPSRPRPLTPPKAPRAEESEQAQAEYRRALKEYNDLMREHDAYEQRVIEYERAMREYEFARERYEIARRQHEAELVKHNELLQQLEREHKEAIAAYDKEYLAYKEKMDRYERDMLTYEADKKKYDREFDRYLDLKDIYDIEKSKNDARDEYEREIAAYDRRLKRYYVDLDFYPTAVEIYEKELAEYDRQMVIYAQKVEAFNAAFDKYLVDTHNDISSEVESVAFLIKPAKGDLVSLNFELKVFDTEYLTSSWRVFSFSDLNISDIETLMSAKELSFKVDRGIFGGPTYWRSLTDYDLRVLKQSLDKLRKM